MASKIIKKLQDGEPFKDVPSFKSPIKTSDNVKINAIKVFYYYFRPYGQKDDHMIQLRPKLDYKYSYINSLKPNLIKFC